MMDLDRVNVDTEKVRLNSKTFDTFIKNIQPTIVLFDRFITEEQFGWRVARHCPGALRILDTEDLHALRRARHKAVREERNFYQANLLLEDTAKREIASIHRCDLSLIISEAEMRMLKDLFEVDPALLHYLPLLVNRIEEEERSWPSYSSRSNFITVGNFRHAPNLDAISYLKKNIWPLIRQELTKVQMHIYGAYPSQKVRQFNDPSAGFLIKGRIPNAAEVVRKARVCLAPLRFGAGLKGKLLEAMECGTPSVTTDIGAEGIAGKLRWSGKIADSSEELARAAIELYTNKKAWRSAQRQGGVILNTRFDKNLFEADLLQRIQSLHHHLQHHRQQNFTGAMLMHHTTAASEYMARWIEAKNR